jgi:deoxyhypusine synthase
MKESKQITVKSGMTVNDLTKQFSSCGVFQAGNIGKAVDLYEDMLNNKTKIMLSVAGALVPGGLRQVISDSIKEGFVDLLVTTGANMTHDLAIAFGEQYLECSHHEDDAKLHEEGISRIYDIASPDKTSEGFEKNIQEIFSKISESEYTTPEFMRLIGKHIKDENSIVRQCFLKEVPIFVPALEDSILGIQLWIHSQDRNIKINIGIDSRTT